jgi:hypothetical protein
MPRAAERVKLSAIIAASVVGSGFICLALLGDFVFGWRDNLLPSLFLEVGSSIALGGLLFVLERQFTTTQREIKGEIDRSREEITDWLSAAEQRLMGLERATEERTRQRHAAVSAEVDQLLDFDHDRLASLLQQERVAPVVTAGITDGPDAFRLAFSLTETGRVSVACWGSEVSFDLDLPSVVWTDGLAPEDFFDAVRARLESADLKDEADAVRPASIVKNLHRTLATAVEAGSAHSPLSSLMAGRVVESLDDDWVLTTEGLVHRRRGLVSAHPLSAHDLGSETDMSKEARRIVRSLSQRVGRLLDHERS